MDGVAPSSASNSGMYPVYWMDTYPLFKYSVDGALQVKFIMLFL